MEKPVTIVQIARESGVSIATVSRVLNGAAPVSEATRNKVEAVIQKHAYTPNSFARGLINRQSMTLGIIMPDISNPYFAGMFQEMEKAAFEAGYSVILCNTAFRSEEAQTMTRRETDCFQMMLDKRVDGVLIAGGQADLAKVTPKYKTALQRLCAQIPTVVLGGTIPEVDCLFIQRERGQGVFSAVNYLASLGHRRIAFVGGEKDVEITEARLSAYIDALNALKLPYCPELIALSDYYAPDGYAAAQALLSKGADFTALLAMNDHVAMGAYRALADKGLSIPKDVSVISCDQFFTADYFIPRLTSIDQHNERFGRFTVNALLGVMGGVKESVLVTHRPELVVRESCAPPA